jgi:TonB family protein
LFQSERAGTRQFSFRDGVLEITPGSGWLRTPRVYGDFELSLEFFAVDEDASADVVFRTLVPEPGVLSPAYRLTVPQLLQATPATAMTGPKNAVRVVREGTVAGASAGGWHRLAVRAVRESVTVTLNGTVVGEYAIDRLAGYLLFTANRGRVRMKNVTLAALEPSFSLPEGTLTMAQINEAGRPPKVRKDVKPFYSYEALHVRKVHGTVLLEAVVLTDGTIGDVRVTRSLDPDLDQSAMATLRQWRFSPGTVVNKPVPVLVEVEMSFSINPSYRY